MKFKLISRLKPYLSVSDLLAAMNFASRGNIQAFEQSFAQTFDGKYGVMFQHGRSGLYSLLKAWGLEDAEVICPAYSCVVVPHAVVLSGNIPVFVDCEKGSPNMSYTGIEDAITDKTRVLIVSHIFGYPMDVLRTQEIIESAEKKYGHKIYVIQDAAHSFGAKWEGKLVTGYGDAALFGLNISKSITSIFGGMITTHHEDTASKLREYRDSHFRAKGMATHVLRLVYLFAVYFAFHPIVYKLVNWLERSKFLDRFVKYYDDDKIYFPADWDRLPSEMEARVGLSQLKKYETIIERRSANALQWIKELEDNKGVQFYPHIEGSSYSHCVGMVEDREEWIENYRKKGYQLGILIEYSIPEMASYQKYKRGEYPISKYYSEHAINFPIHLGVRKERSL